MADAARSLWVTKNVKRLLLQLQLGLQRRAQRRMKSLPTTTRLSTPSSSQLLHHLCRELLKQKFERIDVLSNGIVRHEEFDAIIRDVLTDEQTSNDDQTQDRETRHGITMAIKSVYEFYLGEWSPFIDALLPPQRQQQVSIEDGNNRRLKNARHLTEPPSSAQTRRSGFVAGLNAHIQHAQTGEAGRASLGEG